MVEKCVMVKGDVTIVGGVEQRLRIVGGVTGRVACTEGEVEWMVAGC